MSPRPEPGWRSWRRSLGVRAEDFLLERSSDRFLGGVTGRTGTKWVTRVLRSALRGRCCMLQERGAFQLAQLRSAGYEYYQATPGDDLNHASYLRFFRRFALGPMYDRRQVYGKGLRGFSSRGASRRAVRLALLRLESDLAASTTLAACHQAFGRFYTALLTFEARVHAGTTEWISKEPAYGRHADDLWRMVPGCRLVVLARDGRDVALSMMKRGWCGGDALRCMERWRDFSIMTLDALGRIPPENQLLVHYEWLLTDLEGQLRQITRFYGLDVSEADIASARERNAPRPDSSEKWKSELRPEQLAWFDRHCGATMQRLGYSG